jgi:hypothetical protein
MSLSEREFNFEIAKQKPIKSPVNSLQWLLKFQSMNKSFCLMYLVPFPQKKIKGMLYLEEIAFGGNCPQRLSEETNGLYLEEFSIIYNPNKQILMEFKLVKKLNQKIQIELQDLSSSRAIFNPLYPSSVTIADGELCLEYGPRCEVKIDRCHQCRNGYSLIAGGDCTQKYNKRCGVAVDDDFAFVRGKAYSRSKQITLGCHADSIEGYCPDQKNIVCFDGVLRCQ